MVSLETFRVSVHNITIFQNTNTKYKILQEWNNFILKHPNINLQPISAIFDKGYQGVNSFLIRSVASNCFNILHIEINFFLMSVLYLL